MRPPVLALALGLPWLILPMAPASADDALRDDAAEALRRAVAFFREHVAVEGGYVYRYSDEEFCILLPGAAHAEARAVADRVVAAMRSILLPDGRRVTVSVGVADGRAGDVVGTLESADRALNAAKASGREHATGTDTTDALESTGV